MANFATPLSNQLILTLSVDPATHYKCSADALHSIFSWLNWRKRAAKEDDQVKGSLRSTLIAWDET